MTDDPMTTWRKYKNADGEWAEVGAFILEASVNGSWVVRHKMGVVPCRASADMGTLQEGGVEGAKAACERVLAEVMAAPNGTAALASSDAMAEQKAITVALCRRYQTMRANQDDDMSLDDLHGTTEELDERVRKYLEKHAG